MKKENELYCETIWSAVRGETVAEGWEFSDGSIGIYALEADENTPPIAEYETMDAAKKDGWMLF